MTEISRKLVKCAGKSVMCVCLYGWKETLCVFVWLERKVMCVCLYDWIEMSCLCVCLYDWKEMSYVCVYLYGWKEMLCVCVCLYGWKEASFVCLYVWYDGKKKHCDEREDTRNVICQKWLPG